MDSIANHPSAFRTSLPGTSSISDYGRSRGEQAAPVKATVIQEGEMTAFHSVQQQLECSPDKGCGTSPSFESLFNQARL